LRDKDISEDLKQFVFTHVDSVEQLEVMMLLRTDRDKWWTAKTLSEEMRTSAASIANRLNIIYSFGLVEKDEAGAFRYKPHNVELERTMEKLAEAYRIRKHRIFALIFSPMKKARNFADAFLISQKKDGDDNG
jgi:predicted transcriptional regulator